ncbi:MAG: CHAT domain-containing protein [Cyanobacteria bacterium J06592_8]
MDNQRLKPWDNIKHCLYARIIRLAFLGLFGFMLSFGFPTLSSEPLTSPPQLLLEQGINLYEAEQFSQAIDVWQQAATVYSSQENQLTSPPQLLLEKGINLYEAEQFSQAIDVWQQAATVYSSQENQLTSPPQLLLEQGINLYEAEQFSQAIDVWKQAATVYSNQGNQLALAFVLSSLSAAYQQQGKLQDAEEAITKSLNILENKEHFSDPLAYSETLAKALNNFGSLQWSKGQLNQALQTWKQATEVYTKIGNQTGLVGSWINQARVLQVLGFSRQAYQTLQQVQNLLEQQPDSQLKVIGLQSLGNILRQMGYLQDSEKILQASLSNIQNPTQKSSVKIALANTKRVLAQVAQVRDQPEETTRYIQEVITLYQTAAQVANPKNKISAQLNLLSFFVEIGRVQDAIQLALEIKSSVSNLPTSRSSIQAQLNLAQSLICLHPQIKYNATNCQTFIDYEAVDQSSSLQTVPSLAEIADLLKIALEQARTLQDPIAQSYALGQLGELYELTKNESEAQNFTQQAITIIENLEVPEIRYRWEWQLGRLLKKQGNRQGTIAAYTTALQTLQAVRADLLTIDSEVRFSFRDNVEPIYREFVDLLLSTPDNNQPSQVNLRKVIEILDQLQLAEVENFLSCELTQNQKENQDINQMDKIDPQAALIYPIILPERLDIILKLPQQNLQYFSSPVQKEELQNILKNLRRSVVRGYGEELIEQATTVYNWFIRPLEMSLKNSDVETLIFALDGEFRNTPIAALYDSVQDQYLVEKQYALAILPSSQLFEIQSFTGKPKILGGGIDENLQVESRRFPEINAKNELTAIQSDEILLNSNFTRQNLQQEINKDKFSIVHLATHGKFSSDPEETYILVYGSETGTGELLRARDLNQLLRSRNQQTSDPIDLLVLSACQTASGDNRAILGLAGLAVQAGTRSTLATLWQVEDQPATELIKQFYQKLDTPGMTKAKALHLAQKSILEDPRYQTPKSWAAYILVGSWL